jgi:hypothetical protein
VNVSSDSNDDSPQRLPLGQIQRSTRFPLPAWHMIDGAAHDLGAICTAVQSEHEHACDEGGETYAEERQREVEPEHLHHRGGAAEHFDIGVRRPAQPHARRASAQSGSEREKQRERRAAKRQLQRDA